MYANVNTALALLKIALGVTHDKRDLYFRSMLIAAVNELDGRGITLDCEATEDNMLLADYCEFNYRNRDGDNVMPRNLDLRLRNRAAKGRANNGI